MSRGSFLPLSPSFSLSRTEIVRNWMARHSLLAVRGERFYHQYPSEENAPSPRSLPKWQICCLSFTVLFWSKVRPGATCKKKTKKKWAQLRAAVSGNPGESLVRCYDIWCIAFELRSQTLESSQSATSSEPRAEVVKFQFGKFGGTSLTWGS